VTWADPAHVASEEEKVDIRALTEMALAAHTVERYLHPLQDTAEPSPTVHA
jgi:hypothetical protein